MKKDKQNLENWVSVKTSCNANDSHLQLEKFVIKEKNEQRK